MFTKDVEKEERQDIQEEQSRRFRRGKQIEKTTTCSAISEELVQ